VHGYKKYRHSREAPRNEWDHFRRTSSGNIALPKVRHRVRDGVHGFIYFDNLERDLIDSAPFQRLRSIHQLAMSYQVYPGATHKRFEHCLGVMEVASRIFDTLFKDRQDDSVNRLIAQHLTALDYWRRVVRIAALLHDLGHLPFSHAAEKELLPPGWNHERLTAEIIRHSPIKDIFARYRPLVALEDVINLACDIKGRTRYEPEFALDAWGTLLNAIITDDTFGADRIDYLLRDARHAGVPYGNFDSSLLIDGLRIVIDPDNDQVTLGLDVSAVRAAEALLLARYFMYTQVYFHKARRSYNIHLQEFLKAWLPDGMFSGGWQTLLKISDDEVLTAVRAAALDTADSRYPLAMRLVGRRHFRTVYQILPSHKRMRPTILQDLYEYVCERNDPALVRLDSQLPKSNINTFLVVTLSGLERSEAISPTATGVRLAEIGAIIVAPEIKEKAQGDVANGLNVLLSSQATEEGEVVAALEASTEEASTREGI